MDQLKLKKPIEEKQKALNQLEIKASRFLYKILICDDNEDARLMVKDMLKDIGFSNSTTCGNAKEASEILSSEDFNLILCDLNMGGEGLDGRDLFNYILSHYNKTNAPTFVIVSAQGVYSLMDLSDAQITTIEKPFTKQQFITIVMNQYIAFLKKLLYTSIEG